MSWLHSFFVAVLTAIVSAAAAGLVAAGCVNWYRISPREGGSGYFIISIILLGGFVGFLAGLILSRYFGDAGPAGFFIGLGISTGSVLSVAGAVAVIAWGLADIPPTIHGHELNLVVEARLPKGAVRPAILEGKQFVWFESGPKGAPSRARDSGILDAAKATQVDGRWVVPGSVRIFTARDTRSVTFALDDKHAEGFELRLPGHPGPQYKQWSPWWPNAEFPKWPDSRMSYRYRIEERIPVETPPPPDPFAALTPDSPLADWLKFFDGFGRNQDVYQAIMKQAEKRPTELVRLLLSPNDEEYSKAMDVVQQLKVVDPAVLQGMRDVAAEIEGQIQRFNAMMHPDERDEEIGNHIRNRFGRWCPAWEMVQSRSHVDGRQPLEEILKLASVRRESVAMQGVVSDAQLQLGYLAAAQKKPQ